jgi:hypothetical protein
LVTDFEQFKKETTFVARMMKPNVVCYYGLWHSILFWFIHWGVGILGTSSKHYEVLNCPIACLYLLFCA